MPRGVKKRGQYRFKVWFPGGGNVEVWSDQDKQPDQFVAHALYELDVLTQAIKKYDEKRKQTREALKDL
jgi:hypothetical protein